MGPFGIHKNYGLCVSKVVNKALIVGSVLSRLILCDELTCFYSCTVGVAAMYGFSWLPLFLIFNFERFLYT